MLSIDVLGPLRVRANDRDVTPSGDLQRRLLAALVLAAGRPLGPDRLADDLWGEVLPANHVAALQTQVFRLRKHLPDLPIERVAAGYAARLDAVALDLRRFEELVTDGFACRVAEPERALRLLDEALGRWRSEPFPELDGDEARAERIRLAEVRLRALDERAELLLAAGEAAALVAELEAAAIAQPTRERTHVQLARALAATGRAVDALRTYDRFRRTLADELGVAPSPEFERLHADLLAGTPAAAATAPPARAPRYDTALAGRDAELASLAHLVAVHRLVTLVGTGGVGKTRLAAEASRRAAPSFAGGTRWCNLASSGPGEVVEAVAVQLGVQVRAGEHLGDRLGAAVGAEPVLVVLDNAEHVVDDVADLVEHVLHASDHVHLLVTSRERLAVPGERLLPLGPLPVSDDAGPAVELFLDRAAAVGAPVEDRPEVHQQVARLCTALGGLPLAIELAAAQLHAFDLDVVAAEIERGLGLLSGRRTAGRHRSLAAAMRWSYDLLTDEERWSFLELSVFRGAFDLDGAAAVLDLPTAEASARIRALVERSLLQRADRRWLMLEPLRQLAAEVAASAEGGTLVRRAAHRHAIHLLEQCVAREHELGGPDPAAAFEATDRELPDIRAAFLHLLADGDVPSAAALVHSLRDHAMLRPRHELLSWGAAVAEADPGGEHAATMLALASYSAWARGDVPTAWAIVERARAASDRVHGPGNEPSALADALGLLNLAAGDLDASVRWYEHSLRVMDPADEVRRAESKVVRVLALAYAHDPSAIPEADRVVAELDGGPNVVGTALAWYGAGEARLELDPLGAMPRLGRAVELAERTAAWWVGAAAGASLASLEARHGDPLAAVTRYRWLLPLWTRTGDTSVAWTALRSVAALLHQLGDAQGSAVVLHAVRATPLGHEVFGADAERLDDLEAVLRVELGNDAFEAAAQEGRGLDAGVVAARVLARLPAG